MEKLKLLSLCAFGPGVKSVQGSSARCALMHPSGEDGPWPSRARCFPHAQAATWA